MTVSKHGDPKGSSAGTRTDVLFSICKLLTFSVSKMKANNAHLSLQEYMSTSKKKKKGWTLRFKKLQFRPSLCSLQCLLSLALPTVNWLSILCAVAGKVGVNKLIFSWKRCSNTHPYQLPHQHWQIPPNPDALNSQLLFLSFPISPRSSISSCSIPPRIYLSSLLQQHYPLEVILLLPEVSTKTFVFAEQCCKKMPGVPLGSVEVPS